MDERREQYLGGELDAAELAAIEDDWKREKESDLRAALGEDGFKNWERAKLMSDMHLEKVSLSPDEDNALYDLKKSMQQRTEELEIGLRNGTIDPLDFDAERAKARDEFDQKAKSLLGDERYAVTQGSGGESTATWRRLKTLNVTDAQLQGLRDIQSQLDQQRTAYEDTLRKDPSGAPDYEEFQKSLDQEKEKAYRELLGSDTYEKFQKQEDSRYSQMKQFASAWGIDDSGIEYVYHAIKSYERSMEEQRQIARALEAQGQTVDWSGVGKQQEEMAERARQSLQSYLGEDRFGKLQRNGIFPFAQ